MNRIVRMLAIIGLGIIGYVVVALLAVTVAISIGRSFGMNTPHLVTMGIAIWGGVRLLAFLLVGIAVSRTSPSLPVIRATIAGTAMTGFIACGEIVLGTFTRAHYTTPSRGYISNALIYLAVAVVQVSLAGVGGWYGSRRSLAYTVSEDRR
jgi:hypothetical protein